MQSDLKHNVRRRMEFIEFALYWDGKIGRKRLQDHFAISPQQATNDLNGYIDAAPSNMHYDPRRKSYMKSENFAPLFSHETSRDYLKQLQNFALDHQDISELWIDNPPPVTAAFLPTREVQPDILRSVLYAIENQYSFNIQYVSLRSKDVTVRKVTPHALGTDAQRWHMRAFNHTKERYADFVLTRILEISNFAPSEIDGSNDVVWKTMVDLRLEPEPSLAPEIRQNIANEYRMKDGVLTSRVSQAMLFYFLRQYGFNPAPLGGGKMRNESSFHLSLCDYDLVEKWLERRPEQM